MNTLEDRLRDAYRAAAETVRPELVLQHITSPDRQAGPARPPSRTRLRRPPNRLRNRLLVPLAAAAAVTAVATTAAVLVPRLAGGPRTSTGTSQPTLLTTPDFFVALNWTQSPSMFVVNATTGRQGARITLPFPATHLTAVVTGDDRMFLVAATSPGSCSTSLYRFSLAADGKPSVLAAFMNIAAQVSDPWSMAMSANGQIVAYATPACQGGRDQPSPRHPRAEGYLSVLDTVTGQTKRWSFPQYLTTFPPGTGNVSISADGSKVGFGNRVLATSAAPGSLAAHSRVVAQDGEFGQSVSLGGLNIDPDGKTVYFETNQVANDKPVWTSWQLRALNLATGQTRLVGSFPGSAGSPAAATFDPTGRYLLAESVVRTGPTTELAVLNLATGQLRQLSAKWAENPELAW